MIYSWHRLLKVRVTPMTIMQFLHLIADAVQTKQKFVVGHHNLHSLYLYHHDFKMRRFYDENHYTFVDGMPIILMGRLLGLPFRREQRMTSADWLWNFAEEASKQGWRIFYLGSKPDIAERGAEVLRQCYTGLQIQTASGYFSQRANSSENRDVITQINQYQPNILLVGMGMPLQEHWVFENANDIQAGVIITVGACIDYVAGAIPTPPRWMGPLGLEWLSRLCSEPKRLWKRYLVEPWFILMLLIRDLVSVYARR